MSLAEYLAPASWSVNGSVSTFEPNGDVVVVNGRYARNGQDEERLVTYHAVNKNAARFFVGLNVEQEPVYGMPKVVKTMRNVLRERVGKQDSTYIMQRGVFTHDSGSVVEEDSVQILVFDEQSMTRPAWRNAMIRSASDLAGSLQQESVIVELLRGGIQQDTLWVKAPA